jgi:hypothetical protein
MKPLDWVLFSVFTDMKLSISYVKWVLHYYNMDIQRLCMEKTASRNGG